MDVPASATATDALAWAVSWSPAARSSTPYRALPHVYYWGRPTPPAVACAAIRDAAEMTGIPGARPTGASPRCAAARDIREADEHEDDSGTGTWVIRTDEPQESVEDPFGLQRPTDCADDADPEGLGIRFRNCRRRASFALPGARRRSSALERTCREPWAQPA